MGRLSYFGQVKNVGFSVSEAKIVVLLYLGFLCGRAELKIVITCATV